MPLAVTHVISTIVFIDLFRDYLMKGYRKWLTLHAIMIAGIGGLLPDIDFLNYWLSSYANLPDIVQHGGLTHTPFFGLIFLIPALILLKYRKHRVATYLFMIAFGVLFHITLDGLLGGGAWEGIMLFWPLSTAAYKLHLLLLAGLRDVPVALDAIILLVWLWHEETRHKIKDFI